VVDQFLGDGMVVLLNVPAPRTTHSEDALKAALAIQERLRDAPFGVGIGIETGMALAGHMGVGQAFDFTCVGEPVNLAARLQAIAGPGEIVLGPTVARKCADLIEIRALSAAPEVTEVKGLGAMEVLRIATGRVVAASSKADSGD
jgi:class 3 adenylate cyclase